MLQKLSARIRQCLEDAAEASERAAEARDPVVRRGFVVLERSFNTLARSLDFTERLERLLSKPHAEQTRRQSTEVAASQDKRNPNPAIVGKALISIVEDDAEGGHSLKRFILLFGYASSTFASAEEYLESGLLSDTACLICDIQLPGMSGLDLQARLIADGYRTPIVFVTGAPSETIRARVLTSGAIGYFAKPVNPGALIECLERAVLSLPS
jgi:CheY-like chemotaxis protein